MEQERGVCKICGAERPLTRDHNHATGRIRGVICAECNFGLGKFRDDPGLLRQAATYLEAADPNAQTYIDWQRERKRTWYQTDPVHRAAKQSSTWRHYLKNHPAAVPKLGEDDDHRR
jgi:hypothetical protein